MLLTAPAAAHRPQGSASSGIAEVPNLSTSYAFYERIAGEEVDVYVADGHTGDDLFVGITIPQIDGLEDFGVTLGVVAPGLDPAHLDRIPDVGIDWPAGAGAIVARDRLDATFTDDGDFFEPFTQTRYWERQRIERALPADGPVYFVVWQPDRSVEGRYVLDSGREEVFGPADALRGIGWWFEVNAYFGHWVRIGAALGVIAGLIAVGIGLIRRRNASVYAPEAGTTFVTPP